MTIDEKLQHFYEVSLDEAREDAAPETMTPIFALLFSVL